MPKKILEKNINETKITPKNNIILMVISNRGNYILECFCGGSNLGKIELSIPYIRCGACGYTYNLRELKIDFPKIVYIRAK